MNIFLSFSDAAKYADIGRNVLTHNKYDSLFSFWGYNMADWVQPITPYSISFFYKLFGITDIAVIAASVFYFILSLTFLYLLTSKIFKSKFISILTTLTVGFNYNLINYAISGASESPFIFELLAGTYFLSFKNRWGNTLGILLMLLMYFTRPQAVIYIFGLILYYFISNFSFKKGLVYSLFVFIFGSSLYLLLSKQGLVAVTQNLPGVAVSDSLRGNVVGFDALIIFKKLFYNLYNFYKAIPDIFNPYLFALFILGMFSWGKNKLLNSFKISSFFMVLATFFVTAITIPFYRYIHPVIPFIYIIGVITLFEIIEYFVSKYDVIKNKKVVTNIIASALVLFFAVGQTIGILVLDSRFERKTKNVDKPPIYVLMSWKLKEITNKDDVIVTNLDTWGSWYGERKTIWFPLEPQMILEHKDRIDAIYLTSYKIDDENYYMGEQWREIFENPEKQTILSDYKFVAEYEFDSNGNYEREKGRAVLLVRQSTQLD